MAGEAAITGPRRITAWSDRRDEEVGQDDDLADLLALATYVGPFYPVAIEYRDHLPGQRLFRARLVPGPQRS